MFSLILAAVLALIYTIVRRVYSVSKAKQELPKREEDPGGP
jgi:hypothetical protein